MYLFSVIAIHYGTILTFQNDRWFTKLAKALNDKVGSSEVAGEVMNLVSGERAELFIYLYLI